MNPTDDDENIVGRVAQHLCDYCRKDISQSIRVKCCECTDFILCVYCFASGAELLVDDQNMHRKTHSYGIVIGFSLLFSFLESGTGLSIVSRHPYSMRTGPPMMKSDAVHILNDAFVLMGDMRS